MFNTPLGKKLYENMMGLGYHIMTGKAALYTNVVAMVEEFIEKDNGNVYLSKSMTMADIEKLILYINDGTDYRFDMKSATTTKSGEIVQLLYKHEIKHDIFDPSKPKDIKLSECTNQFGIWNDNHYDKITFVINTGMKGKSVLHIDVVIK